MDYTNTMKAFGNIVFFQNLKKETNSAIALFDVKEAIGIVLLKSYRDDYFGYEDDKSNHQKRYGRHIAELVQKYPRGVPIIDEQSEKDFSVLLGNIVRLRNILSYFDRFVGQEILVPINLQDYTGTDIDRILSPVSRFGGRDAKNKL